VKSFVWKRTLGLSLAFGTALLAHLGADPRQLVVEYHSVPEGAKVFQNDRFLGETPLRLPYAVQEDAQAYGFVQLAALRFQWRSGQTQTVSPRIDLSASRYDQTYTVTEENAAQDDYDYEAYQQALADYRQALAEYQNATKALDDYVGSRQTSEALGRLEPGNKVLQFLNSLGSVLDPTQVSSRVREAEISKLKLDEATTRLNQFGGRFGGSIVNLPPSSPAATAVAPPPPAPPAYTAPAPQGPPPKRNLALGGSPLGTSPGGQLSAGLLSYWAYHASGFFFGSELRVTSADFINKVAKPNPTDAATWDFLLELGGGGQIAGGVYLDLSACAGLAGVDGPGTLPAVGFEGGTTVFITDHFVFRLDGIFLFIPGSIPGTGEGGYAALDFSVGYGF